MPQCSPGYTDEIQNPGKEARKERKWVFTEHLPRLHISHLPFLQIPTTKLRGTSQIYLFCHSGYRGSQEPSPLVRTTLLMGIPRWLSGRVCLNCRRLRFDPWAAKIPWRRERQPPLSHKESDMTEVTEHAWTHPSGWRLSGPDAPCPWRPRENHPEGE